MAGWNMVKIGDVCKTGSGGTPLKAKKEYYERGYIPWLQSGEVSQGEIFQSKNFITDAGLQNSAAKIFPPNTVLVAMYGATAGQVGILRFPASTNQAVCGIYPNKNFLPEFLYYALLSKQEELIATATGNAQPNISQIKIKNTEIPFLTISEQKRIVNILDEAFEGIDAAIANTEKNLANTRELFENRLRKIFVQKGENWSEKTLSQVSIDFGRGRSRHRPRNDKSLYGGKYPFIQTGDIRNSRQIITEHTQTYNEKGLAQSKLWPKGTLCITIAANIAETGILDFDACFPDSVIGMVVDPLLANVSYVEYLLQFSKAILQAQGKGSAQDNINLGTFENQYFPFPLLEEQELIVEQLNELSSNLYEMEEKYKRKVLLLNELKQSLLQKIFRGELTSGADALAEVAA